MFSIFLPLELATEHLLRNEPLYKKSSRILLNLKENVFQ